MKYIIKRSTDKQYYFVIVARNGEIVATSELYKRKQSAIDTIKAIQEEAHGYEDDTKIKMTKK